jgi:hypothetical protein
MRSVAMWGRRRPALAASALLTAFVALGGVLSAAYFAGKAADISRRYEQRTQASAAAAGVVRSIRTMLGKVSQQRLLQDALPSSFLVEWLAGSAVIGEPETLEVRWARRVEVLAAFLDDRRRAGLDESIETLFWEMSLGLFVLDSGDYSSAEPLLRKNLASWKARLVGGDDPFLRLVDRLIAAASVQRLKAAAASGALSVEQRAEAETLGAQLQPLLSLDAEHVCRARVHELAIQAYADLCGPALLNRPADAAKARSLLDQANALR